MTRTEHTSTRPSLRRGSTVSADGTPIGWWSMGDGPGLLVVHGSMQSGLSQRDLAGVLAGEHTVHLLDRRGRGVSGPWPAAGVTPVQELADLAAVVAATGSRELFGVSSGAILVMRAALADPGIERIAVFEPPIAVGDSMKLELLDTFAREYATGEMVNAMVSAMKLAEMGPPVMLRLPDGVLRAATRRLLAGDEARRLDEGFVHQRELALALPADFAIVTDNAHRAADFGAIRAETLLLAGTKTRPYLRAAVDALATAIPAARRVDLPGTNHGVTQNRDQWGKPDLVARELMSFFRI